MNIIKRVPHIIWRHKIVSIIGCVIVAFSLIALWPKPSKPIPTQKIEKGELVQTLSLTGTITAEKFADLTFRVPGKLSQLYVKKGDNVTANQTIALLDQQTAMKNLKTALINYSLQRNTFDQTNVNQQAAKPQDALNETMRRLLQNNQYNLDLAINSVEIGELARQEAILTTPLSGIVTRADAKLSGVNVTTATTFTVVDPQSITFRMEVDEADISKVKEGQEVVVDLSSYQDETLKLHIDSIDFVTHTTTTGGNAFDVKAKIPSNPNYKYRAGMNGNASIITKKKSNVVKIPISSLIEDNKVYIKNGDKYEKRGLKLGVESDTDVEVITGVSEGEMLVLDPSVLQNNK